MNENIKDSPRSSNSALTRTDVSLNNRGSWGSPVEFVLACLGYAVGLGNVWRFPYLAYRNGGGAFLLPFFIMMVCLGLPIFYLELYIGQYTGLGPIKAFGAISPFFSGLGYCTLVVITIISIYFMVIVAWTAYYTLVSIFGTLGWGQCGSSYNTDHCYSGQYDKTCRVNNTGDITDLTFYMRQCMSIGDICTIYNQQPVNGTHCYDEVLNQFVPWYQNATRVLASEEFYNEHVLGRGDATWENWGSIQWHLVGCLLLSWVVAFFCVIKGVQSAGKVVYFTALFPYVMLTALLVRGVTLNGAKEGILYYIIPEWSRLADGKVWGDAASQIFYSFGVGCGSLVTLASYNKYTNNCHFDAIFVSFTNFFTSVYAGFAIFSVLGFLADEMGVEVSDVAKDGPGLAFIAYPEALLQMPIPRLWAILFFFMMFILGLGSQFGGIEAMNTAIIDQWPYFRDRKWLVTLFTCTTCFILGIPMCFSGGVYLFTLLDWNTASWAILLIGAAECISVAWSYGVNRALYDLRTMDMKLSMVTQWYWKIVWSIIVPIGSVGLLVFIFWSWQNPSYEDYIFPLEVDILGWLVGLSTLILFPVGTVWALCKGYTRKDLFKPTSAWKPADKVYEDPSNATVNHVHDKEPAVFDNYGYVQ